MDDIYYIFKCPECGGLQVDTEPESVLQACIHSQGRGKQAILFERERIEVIPRPDNRWLVVAEEELRPIVEQAGVDEVAQAGAALDALAKYREATDE